MRLYRLARPIALAGALMIALAPTSLGARAQSELEIALGIYEELRPLVVDGELDPETALELLDATERLVLRSKANS